jgi:CHAD domain-containing protein
MNAMDLVSSYGATVLLKHLAALRQEAPGVRLAQDIECIHRMRVASRRQRAALPLFADCFTRKQVRLWLEQIKGITRALGTARDTDVKLALLQKIEDEITIARFRPGVHRLILRIVQERQGLQGPINAALDELDQTDFYTQMETALLALQPELPPGTPYPHLLFERGQTAIVQRLEELLAFDAYVDHPECVTELHAMRIAAKQLRYTLETFTPLYPAEFQLYLQAVKNTQELLGDIHDSDVWLVYLPQFIQDERQRTLVYYGHTRPFNPLLPGLEYFQENRRLERAQRYQEFQECWIEWKSQALWEQLRQAIAAPVFQNIFPKSPDRSDAEDLTV